MGVFPTVILSRSLTYSLLTLSHFTPLSVRGIFSVQGGPWVGGGGLGSGSWGRARISRKPHNVTVRVPLITSGQDSQHQSPEHSGQKMLRPFSAVKSHFHSCHTHVPAFSVGGSIITEWAFITECINNALAFAVCSLLLSLWWWIVSLSRFSNVTVIYDNVTCLERPGSKLFTEGWRTRLLWFGAAGGNSSVFLGLWKHRVHPRMLH